MKKDEQLRTIRKSVETWNQLRLENSSLQPDLSKVNLYKANLGKANLRSAKLVESDLTRANLNGADLREADLRGADLREADLRGTNLSNAELGAANLAGAFLSGANLSGANLAMADLTETDLKRVNLSHAHLGMANLRGANLKEADLSTSDMTGCILDGVNLILANLSGADVSGASFWDIANAGWKIDGIKAGYVYFCRGDHKEKEKYRLDFEAGRFEELHRTQPMLELVFTKGLTLPGLISLNALIEKIGAENPALGMKPADISSNEFGTIIRVKVGRDALLHEAGKLIQDAIDLLNNGISAEIFITQLSQMLAADVVTALENAFKAQPVNLVINLDQPIITLIKAGGSTILIPKFNAYVTHQSD